MNTIVVDAITDPLWHRLVAQQPSSLFHSPSWLSVVADTYGFDLNAYVVVGEDGAPLAGVPVGHITDIRGERLTTRAFSDYCDPIAADERLWSQLSAALVAQGVPVSLRCLHNALPGADINFEPVGQAKWHAINLTPDLDTLWASIDSSARRAIKKAQRIGVEVRAAQSKADLQTFFDLHLHVRKQKYKLIAQPYAFFEAIWDHFIAPGRGTILLAYCGGRAIGSVVFLEWKDTFYYKFNASDADFLECRPNDLILWEGIRRAKQRGFTKLDFGLSDWDQTGLLHYKRKYASEEGTITFLQHTPPRFVGVNGGSAKADAMRLLHQMTALFTDPAVPDRVTAQAGAALYRYFV